jgi:hypothetical protein
MKTPFLKNPHPWPRSNPFGVPAGYFEKSEQRLLNPELLNQADLHTGIGKDQVPEGYFENLPAMMQKLAYLETLKTNDSGFLVPENYFEENHAALTSLAGLEALSRKNENPFSVPPKDVRVVPLPRSKNHLIRYMAAAGIALLFTLGVYLFSSDSQRDFTLSEKAKNNILENPGLYHLDEQLLLEGFDLEAGSSNTESDLEDYILRN